MIQDYYHSAEKLLSIIFIVLLKLRLSCLENKKIQNQSVEKLFEKLSSFAMNKVNQCW